MVWLLPVSTLAAQNSADFAFTDHEYVEYNVFYNWGFIWLEAGEVYFKTDKKSHLEEGGLQLESFGTTLPNYDWIFKVRGIYSSIVDESALRPFQHNRDTYEDGYELHNHYVFDYGKKKLYGSLENSSKPFHRDTFDLKPGAMDVLTATYFVRNMDFSTMQVNDTIPVSIILGGEYFHIYIRYLGQETIEDRKERIWNCLKFSALLVEGTIFDGGEDMFVWVTNDANKIPVMVEARIIVGSVKAYLDTWEGVKYPLEYAVPEK